MYSTKDVYTDFVKESVLLDKHREELKTKRGFTDVTIDACYFRSAHDGNRAVIDKLLERYERGLLKDAGLLDQSGEIPKQLLVDNIIIPYLTNKENHDTQLIRPHKYGLKDVDVEPYCEGMMRSIQGDRFILAESEFKAAACWQLGFPAVGIPGIASFSRKHFDRLVATLESAGVKKLCVVFDNEIKDNQHFANYKPDPTKRWDTQFYAYIMAVQLEECGFDVTIGTVPNRFMREGKADLDGAIQMGMTLEDLEDISRYSKEPKEYYHSLPKEAITVFKKKKKAWSYDNRIVEDDNCYVVFSRTPGEKKSTKRKVSNFVIRIRNTYNDGDKSHREVYFLNEFDETSRVFMLDARQMTNMQEFEQFCFDKGQFIWKGTRGDLKEIWEREIFRDQSAWITIPNHSGQIHVPDHDVWVLRDAGIIDGERIPADDCGVIRHDDFAFKPSSLSQEGDKLLMPMLNKEKYDIREAVDMMEINFKNPSIRIAVGWVAATFFVSEIAKRYRLFPFLFLAGRRMSGKTTLARWLMALAGVETGGKSFSSSTPVGIARYLGYYSSLPVWFDEYRNDARSKNKESFLRNVYDRQGSGKGTKHGHFTREEPIRGTLMISGEETPFDNALLTRAIVIHLQKRVERKENEIYYRLQEDIEKLSYFGYDIVSRRAELTAPFMAMCDEYTKYLCREYSMDQRIAINYSMAIAGYFTAFGKDEAILNNIVGHATAEKKDKDAEEMLNNFFDGLSALHAAGKFNDHFYNYDPVLQRIYLFFSGAYSIWAPEYDRVHGGKPFKQAIVKRYISEEKYFMESSKVYKLRGTPRRCIVLDARQVPDEARFMIND